MKIFNLIIIIATVSSLSAQSALTEGQAVELALQEHPALEAAAYRVAQHKALLPAAGAFNPTEFFHNITADPSLGIFGTVTVGAMQSFPNGRTVRARRSNLERQVEYAESGSRLAKRELVRQVREIYRHLAYLDTKARLFQRIDSLYTKLGGLAEVRYRSGDVAAAERLSLQDKAGQVRLALETIGHEIAFDRLILAQLLGRSEPVQTIAEPLAQGGFSPADTVRLMQAASARHSALAVELARSEQTMAEAQKTPNFAAGLYGQYLANGLVYPGWQITVHAPIDRRQLQSTRAAARLNVLAAEADYKTTLLQQRTELWHLLHEQEKYEIELAYYEQHGRKLARELVHSAVTNYQSGELDYWQLIQELQQAFQIDLNGLENLYGLNKTVLELQTLLD